MATSKSQRIGIWIITIALVLGTVISFVGLVFSNDQALEDAKKQSEIKEKLAAAYQEYQTKVEEVSAKYYPAFSAYSTSPSTFDSGAVTSLTTKDLVVGTGDEITPDTKFGAYYIGWTPEGVVFDQSIVDESKTLKPLFVIDGKNAQVITGWKEGLLGMGIGGVRELTIPADKAYGEAGSGDKIKPNTPLKFIVMAVPSSDIVPEPDFNSLVNN